MAVGDVLRLFVIVAGAYMFLKAILSLAKRKMTEPFLSCMGGFVCIDDFFRYPFKSVPTRWLYQHTGIDPDHNNCVRDSVGIVVYQHTGIYPEKKKSGACHADFVIKQ